MQHESKAAVTEYVDWRKMVSPTELVRTLTTRTLVSTPDYDGLSLFQF